MTQNSLGQIAPKNSKSLPAPTSRGVVKNELLDGRVVTRSPSNRWHNIITANFAIAIGSRVSRSNCEIYAGDMAVELGRNSTVFPDLVVVSGEPHFADENFEVLQNPTVVVEIFSPSSRAIDRAQRMEGFLATPSIRECLLVSETEMRVEHYARQNAKQWIYRIHNERDDVISLDSINCKLSLAEVYTQVKARESELSSRAVN
jgi:Uma2 family endonuclease